MTTSPTSTARAAARPGRRPRRPAPAPVPPPAASSGSSSRRRPPRRARRSPAGSRSRHQTQRRRRDVRGSSSPPSPAPHAVREHATASSPGRREPAAYSRTRRPTGSGRTSAASPSAAVSIVTFAPIASPAASPARPAAPREDAGERLLRLGAGEQEPDRERRVSPSRRAARATFSTKSSAPATRATRRRHGRSRTPAVRAPGRPAARRAGQAWTSVTGIEESAGRSSADGAPAGGDHLRAERGDHRAVVGAQPRPRHPQRDPGRRAALLRPAPAAASWPPPRRRQQVVDAVLAAGVAPPCGSARRRRPPGSDAATSGDRHRLAGAPRRRLDPARHRGLQAGEREVVAVPARSCGAVSPRGNAIAAAVAVPGRPGRCAGRRGTAARAAGRPCRTPRPRRRRWSRRAG